MTAVHRDNLSLSDASIARLSDRLSEQEQELAEAALHRVRRDVPIFAEPDGSVLDRALVDGVTEHVRHAVVGLGRGREVPGGASSAGLGLAREVARGGIPVDTLLRAYRIVHRVLWDATVAHMRALLDADKTVVAMLVTSRYFFTFTHVVTRALIEAHSREQVDRARARHRREHQVVRDVLSGLPFDRSQVAYRFDRHHLSVVTTGKDVEAAIRQIAEVHGADVLIVRRVESVVWAWLGFARGSRPALRAMAQSLTAGEPAADGVTAGVGEIAPGVEGFRRTHRQAVRAFTAAQRFSMPYAAYGDISLISLVSADPDACAAFVRRELGPLLEPGHRMAGLRATLHAYFTTGQKSSAAKLLGVSDRTISYRLGSVDEALGHPVDARRLELSVALRLAWAEGLVDRDGGAA